MPMPAAIRANCAADRAESDDAAGLSVELHRLAARPVAGARGGVDLRDAARDREQQGQGVFGDRDGGHAGRVGDRDAVARGGGRSMWSVPVPHTETRRRRGQAAKTRVGEFHGGADVEDQLGVADARDEVVLRAGERVVVIELGAGGEFRPDGAWAEYGWGVVGDVDRHGQSEA